MTIELHPDVAHALAEARRVVALESTLICHGLAAATQPYSWPRNSSRRSAPQAAVPATVAVIDGQINESA